MPSTNDDLRIPDDSDLATAPVEEVLEDVPVEEVKPRLKKNVRRVPQPLPLPPTASRATALVEEGMNMDIVETSEELILVDDADVEIDITENEVPELGEFHTSLEDDFGDDEVSELVESDDLGDESVEISVEEEVSTKDEEKFVHVHIGQHGESKASKKFANFTPSSNIKVVDSDDYQRAIVDQYIVGSKGGPFVGPKGVTRTILPYSGIFYDITTFTNAEMLGIHRSSNDMDVVEKIEQELFSAYEHTKNSTFKKELEFDEWLRNIKYPDFFCIYWGVHNVNYPGIYKYTSVCDHCNHRFEESRDNMDITFVSESSKEDIDQKVIDQIKAGADRSNIKSFLVGQAMIEKPTYLPDSKIKVFQGMPNMEDVINFLKYIKSDLGESDDIVRRVLYPISWMALDKRITKSTVSKVLAYKHALYTRKLIVPLYEESETEHGKKIHVTYVNVKSIMIPPILMNLSKEDYKVLAEGTEHRKLMKKEGIHFRIKDSVCPKCNGAQKDTVLDMRDILFTRAASMMDSIIDM